MKVRIVGFDVSLRNFGIVQATLDLDTMRFVVDDMTLVNTEDEATKKKTVRKNSDDLRRARLLYQGMLNACEGASFMFCEVPVGSQSSRAMASYGVCVGILAACPIPMFEVMPTEVKYAAIGKRAATKQEVIEAAMLAHPEARWPTRKVKGVEVPLASNEHLADAVMAIEAGIATPEFKQAVALMRTTYLVR